MNTQKSAAPAAKTVNASVVREQVDLVFPNDLNSNDTVLRRQSRLNHAEELKRLRQSGA